MDRSSTPDAPQRTTALALWRYAHDYLRVTKVLCSQQKIRCDESQVPFHLMAQSIEFALKAHLRAKGLSTQTLKDDIGHSLDKALAMSLSLGLSPLPEGANSAIAMLAPHHGEDAFRYLPTIEPFPEVRPLYAAAAHVLDAIADEVVQDYVDGYGGPGSPTKADFVRRLRADLSATLAD